MNVIHVKITTKYGKELIYPMCEKATLFCQLLGSKTLTRANIDIIKALGFSIDVVPEVTSL